MGKVANMKIDYNQLLKHLNQQIFFSPKLSKITYWQSLLCSYISSFKEVAFKLKNFKNGSELSTK